MSPGYLFPDCRILVFARSPEPGRVKTRLAKSIGESAAAECYTGWVEQQVSALCEANIAPLEIWACPDSRHPLFRRLSENYPLVLRQQPEGDLGTRMSVAFTRTLADHRAAVLIGTDAPVMTAEYVGRAFQVLDSGVEVVLGPSEDGGYVLVGQERQHACLFRDIPWSTPGVMGASRRCLVKERTSWGELETLWDIDTVDELERWQALVHTREEVMHR